MRETLVPTSNSRTSLLAPWGLRAMFIAALGCMGLASACAPAVAEGGENAEQGEDALREGETNLCIGQPANTFFCLDSTRFQHCAGTDQIFIKECPANLCATRTPAFGNPCIGRAAAAAADGVEPPQPGNAGNAAPPPPPPPPPPAVDEEDGDVGVIDNGGNNNNAGNNDTGGKAAVDTGDIVLGEVFLGTDGSECGGEPDGFGTEFGPDFDRAGPKNVGNGVQDQFINGQCLSNQDCQSGCCARPCGICSGRAVGDAAGKQGCGFPGLETVLIPEKI